MSDSAQTRRSFIKDSASKTIIASHAAVVAGLINTPGIVNAVGGGTTTPQTTVVGHKKSTTTRSKSNGPVTGDPYAYWDSAKESALQKARAAATQVGNASIVDPCGQDEQSGIVSNNSVFNPSVSPGGAGPFTVTCDYDVTLKLVESCYETHTPP